MGPDLSALETLELLQSWAMAKKHPILDEKKKEVIFDDVFLKVRVVERSLGVDAVRSDVLMRKEGGRKTCVCVCECWVVGCFDHLGFYFCVCYGCCMR